MRHPVYSFTQSAALSEVESKWFSTLTRANMDDDNHEDFDKDNDDGDGVGGGGGDNSGNSVGSDVNLHIAKLL